jgi:hypothetical protein
MPYKNIEQRRAYARAYYAKNRDSKSYMNVSKPHNHEKYKAYINKTLDKYLVRSSRNSAKQRGLEHTITANDITIPTHCPLLGTKLEYGNISLDRIDNTKGYVPGNIMVMSGKANFMKRDASWEELVLFAQNILKLHDMMVSPY